MAKQQKVEIAIPKGSKYSRSEKEAIAQDIIDYIVDRSKSGLDKNNRKFKKYSKEYIKSIDFKVAGKSRSNIDLTLTGDMLDSLQILNVKKNGVVIGYEKGDPINGKVEGNILGTYGQKTSTGKARDFLGITKKDLSDKILSNYPIEEEESILRAAALGAVAKAARGFTDEQ
jgi:hypothetical protein